MRIRFALAAPALVVALLAGAVGWRSDRTPTRVAVAAAAPTVTTPAYTGPTTDRRHELEVAITAAQRDALDRFYAEAARQQAEREAAAKAVASARGKSRTGGTADPAPAPAPSGDALTAIAAHFGDVYNSAVGVARCESGLNPGNVSPGGGNWGLFQINTVHKQRVIDMGYSWSQILNADVNAAVARSIYDEQGWGPWSCRWAA